MARAEFRRHGGGDSLQHQDSPKGGITKGGIKKGGIKKGVMKEKGGLKKRRGYPSAYPGAITVP